MDKALKFSGKPVDNQGCHAGLPLACAASCMNGKNKVRQPCTKRPAKAHIVHSKIRNACESSNRSFFRAVCCSAASVRNAATLEAVKIKGMRWKLQGKAVKKQ